MPESASNSWILALREFHTSMVKLGVDINYLNSLPRRVLHFRESLLKEEFHELTNASWSLESSLGEEEKLKENYVKELTDLLYVVCGTFVTLGIDAEEAFRRVHESNMTKFRDAKFRKNGKLRKGRHYVPPDMTNLFYPRTRLAEGEELE